MNRTRRSGDRSTVEHQLLLRRSGDPDMYAGPLICSGTSGNNKCRTVTTAGAGRPEEATSVVVQQARSRLAHLIDTEERVFELVGWEMMPNPHEEPWRECACATLPHTRRCHCKEHPFISPCGCTLPRPHPLLPARLLAAGATSGTHTPAAAASSPTASPSRSTGIFGAPVRRP